MPIRLLVLAFFVAALLGCTNHRTLAKQRMREAVLPIQQLQVGDSIETVKRKLHSDAITHELDVVSPSGVKTPYSIIEYLAPIAEELRRNERCFIFLDGQYVKFLNTDVAHAQVIAYADLVTYLEDQGSVSFYEGEQSKFDMATKSLGEAPDSYEQEFTYFKLWQAQRVDSHEITKAQYQYLLAQKERELKESKEAVANGRRVQAQMATSNRIASEAVDLQRRQIFINALTQMNNAIWRPTYRPTLNCNTSYFGSSASTTCY